MRSEVYSVYVNPGESLFDIVVRETGSLEALPDILRLNRQLMQNFGPTTQIVPGTQLLLQKSSPVKFIETSSSANGANASTTAGQQNRNVVILNAGSASGDRISNDYEPATSTDKPNPDNANYYLADDYEYHYINGKWKRKSINNF
jgi:hypothetical protein